MYTYLAVKDGSGMFLSKSEQMDKALNNGFSIYQVDENDQKTLIATPQDGFLIERPVIENISTFNIN